jgi:hypothetical protein
MLQKVQGHAFAGQDPARRAGNRGYYAAFPDGVPVGAYRLEENGRIDARKYARGDAQPAYNARLFGDETSGYPRGRGDGGKRRYVAGADILVQRRLYQRVKLEIIYFLSLPSLTSSLR